MLGANPSPQVGVADACLRDVGIDLRGKDTFHVNDVGIFFGKPDVTVADPYFNGEGPERTGCTFCGSCMIGCPVVEKILLIAITCIWQRKKELKLYQKRR